MNKKEVKCIIQNVSFSTTDRHSGSQVEVVGWYMHSHNTILLNGATPFCVYHIQYIFVEMLCSKVVYNI